MIKSFLLFSLTFFIQHAWAQNLKWAGGMGGNNLAISSSIAVDDNGNVYTTGFYTGNVDFDPGAASVNISSAGNRDIFISKLDVAGKFVWAKSIGGAIDDNGVALTLDRSGNIFITGNFSQTVDFDPGPATFNLSSNNTSVNSDIFILKLDTAGNFQWAKNMGGIGYISGTSIKLDKFNNIYTTGTFKGTIDFDPGLGTFSIPTNGYEDIFISKLDASGDFLWAKNIGGGGWDDGCSIAVDSSGNVYTTGWFEGTTDFDPGSGTYNLVSSGFYDVFILKLSGAGNFIWAKRIGGNDFEQGNSIAIDDSGNVYTVGKFAGTVDFDPGTAVFNKSAFMYSGFIVKLNSSGNFILAKTFETTNGLSRINSITLDKEGNIYSTGIFTGIIDFDPDSGTYNLNGSSDVFISKLDASVKFVGAIKTSGSLNEEAFSIAVDTSQNIFITGGFSGQVDFDPDIPAYYVYAKGTYDFFVAKYCSVAAPAGPVTGATTVCEGATHTYFISPVAHAIGYLWSVPPGSVIVSGQNTISITVTFGNVSGDISVKTINNCGYGISRILAVKVNLSPVINYNVNPAFTICAGSPITLSGTGGVTYSWSGGVTNGVPFIPGSTSTYTVKGTNASGCSSTNSVTITVSPVINFSVQPINQTLNAGTDAMFIAGCSGSNINFQWEENSGIGFVKLMNIGPYSGVNNDTLIISAANVSQNNNIYRCIAISGACSDTSNNAILKVNCPLIITTQPLSETLSIGSQALFTIQASDPLATFQWQQDSGNGFINLSNTSNVSGVYNDSLILHSISFSQDNYKYRCIVSEGTCSVNSSIAVLKVNKTGISEATEKKHFSIFPNPADNYIIIISSIPIIDLGYTITDALGKQVMEGKVTHEKTRINISILQAGFYFVHVSNGRYTESFNLVRKND